MKLYIWKHKNTAMNMFNFYPLSHCKKAGDGFYGVACHAFFKKKEAIAYLDEIGWTEDIKKFYELITVTL